MGNREDQASWAADVARSVTRYNEWFMGHAPQTFRAVRASETQRIKQAFDLTRDLTTIDGAALRDHPEILPVLRMCMAPPIAVDRLVGLAAALKNVVSCMEEGKRPSRIANLVWEQETERLASVLGSLLDTDLFPWLTHGREATGSERDLAAGIVADRLCVAKANPLIRNAQEERQLDLLEKWLQVHGYNKAADRDFKDLRTMKPGTYALRVNVRGGAACDVIVTVDAVIQPHGLRASRLPMLLEAKSAGDFTNVNKRRKEESDKMTKLRACYGSDVGYVLLLGGYFDTNYLTYEAEAGIDFVWEHRLDDLSEIGL